jgi:predicted transcriptional regulator
MRNDTLKVQLDELGLGTRAAAAEALGVTVAAVGHWIAGIRPTPRYVHRILSLTREVRRLRALAGGPDDVVR